MVKNPVFGSPNGGPVEREVPWREGASTRSATHADLVRLLVPLQKLPNYEVLAGRLLAQKPSGPDDQPIDWTLHLAIYIEPKSEGTMVIPFHRCQASLEFTGGHSRIEFGFVSLKQPIDHAYNIERRSRSLTIDSSDTEILVGGPGLMLLTAIARAPIIEGPRT